MEEYIIWTVSGNRTAFEFSQDSLNSMNSAKAFREKLKCDGFMPTHYYDVVPPAKDVPEACGREMWLPLAIQCDFLCIPYKGDVTCPVDVPNCCVCSIKLL